MSKKGQLRIEAREAETEPEERLPYLRELGVDGLLRQTPAYSTSDETTLSDEKPSSRRADSISLPIRHFVFLLVVITAIGYFTICACLHRIFERLVAKPPSV